MDAHRIIMEGREVSVGYGGRKNARAVLPHLDFTLRSGELVCLLGANGVGKSTLLRTLAAVQPPLSGSISLLNRPIGDYTERERSRAIGIVLTEQVRAGGLTVRELVALGRQPYTGFFGRLDKTDRAKTDAALRAVGMADKAQRYVAELSDGERQKVMIAKALVQECPLILLDEPTAFLDVVNRIEIMTLLHRLATEENRAILLSTHDVEQALKMADRLWLLTADQGLECGTPEDLVLSHRMDHLFPHTDIQFDSLRGGYAPLSDARRPLVMVAADEELRHWAENALRRIGWTCLSPGADTHHLPTLEIRSAKELVWSANGENIAFSTFGQLTEHLSSGGC